MKKLGVAFTALALMGLLVATQSALVLAANPPEPTYAWATVDGNPGEWNLAEDGTGDFFANMIRAGGQGGQTKVESKVYLRYDCSTGTLYALVLAEPNVDVLQQPDNAWIKIDGPATDVDGDSGNDGTPPDFEWVWVEDELRGYEASVFVSEGSHTFSVHIQVFDDGEGQTSAAYDLELVIECPETGTIIIHKDASWESDRAFPFQSDMGNFSLVDDSTGTLDTITFSGLSPDSYDVAEVVPDGWSLVEIDCDDPDTVIDGATASIDLDAGETVQCTFVNDPDPGTIIIEKFTDPRGLTEFSFSFTHDISDANGFSLADGESIALYPVDPGSYAVTEVDPADTLPVAFSLSDLVCEDNDAEGTPSGTNPDDNLQAIINLDPGETVTCSFTNKKDDDTAIELASFTAKPGAGAVRLAWQTATEIDNAGFNLYRATSADGRYTKVNDALIAADGAGVSGASYSFLDQRLLPGTYFYKLEDVDLNGVATMHGPVSATVLPRFRRPAYRPTLPDF